MVKFGELAYYAAFGASALVRGVAARNEAGGGSRPLVAGLAITDACNLQCRHCVVANAGLGHYPFERVMEWARTIYDRGARILYLQGGEPLGWRDGDLRVDDIIRAARKLGYFRVAIASNGTLPIESEADVMWVSVDGSEPRHDEIREPGSYGRLMRNLALSKHPRIMANMTVNAINRGDVEEVIRTAAGNSKLKGVSINFHTPYPGVEDLAVPREERAGIVALVAGLKRRGLPVLNSYPGLRALATGKYARPVGLVNLVESDRLFECCWGRDEDGLCRECGYAFIAELSLAFGLSPGAVLQAFKIFS